YSIKTANNKLLYKISNKTDYDIPYSGIEVFDNGSSVLIKSFYGTLAFFNNAGIKIKETKLSESLGFEYERNIRTVVDNNSLLVIFREGNKDNSTLQKYSSDGTLEKSFKLNQTNINGVAYSEALDQIYISFVKWNNRGEPNKEISLINEDGQLIKSYSANFEKGCFTDNNRFVAFSNRSLLSINTEDMNINFLNKATNNKLFLDVTAVNEIIIAVVASPLKLQNGKWVYNNPTILRLNSSGKIIEQNNFDISFSEFGFRKSGINIQFVADNKPIVLK
ncbi:MAG: hypothetical protein GXO85_16240, partial [Chlorobi bacterium]|nr:hypothetical protein [Chlorobiota bacterium]